MDTPDKKQFLVDETRAIKLSPAEAAAEEQAASAGNESENNNASPNESAPDRKPDIPKGLYKYLGTTFAQRYQVLELLGRGGVGAVFKVKHLHLDKHFALKILYTQSGMEEDALKRFQQEAKLGTRLDHPGIARVHDFGVFDNMPYMVMDLLTGEPLSELLKRNELKGKRLCNIFCLILGALSHAHEKNIVHRDIKPANILVSKNENDEDEVTVVDLGIAKVLDTGNKNLQLTKTGDVFGTPLYMSPEQCLGQPVDSRSDLYSLGCVLYEAVTGKIPFKGETVYEIINKHVQEAPPAFSPELRKSKEGRMLETIVLKAIAKEPQNRYQFALEMASELKQLELAQPGVATDLKIFFKSFAVRMNAVQKGAAAWLWSVNALSLIAITMAFMMGFAQTQIPQEFKELERNADIIKELPDLVDGNTPLRFQNRLKVRNKFEHLYQLTKKDPKQLKELSQLKKEYSKALQVTETQIRKAHESINSDRLQNLVTLFRNFGQVTAPWTQASWYRASLYGSALQKYLNACDHLSFYLRLQSWLPYAGLLCLGAIFGLLTYKWKERFKTQRAYDQARRSKTESAQT